MKISRLCWALSAAVLLVAQAAVHTVAADVNAPRAAGQNRGRVIVTYRQTQATAMSAQMFSGGATTGAEMLNRRHALDLRDGRTVAPRTQVLISDTMSSGQLQQVLANDPDVAAVMIDGWRRPHAAPNDLLYPAGQASPYPSAGQWYLRAPTASVPAGINAEGAWNRTTGSSNVIVAVVDSGVRPEHPDLAGKLLPGFDFVHQEANSNDGDLVDGDPSDPGDWVSMADLTGSNRSAFALCTEPSNSDWHGTQTAALIGAATNNGQGIASIGRNVMVLPVRVLGKCGGFDADIIAGMRWAAGLAVGNNPVNPNPAKVINLSLGYAGTCGSNSLYPSVVAELNQAGVVVVASAGNDDLAVNTPANCAGIIAVAGLRHAGDKSGYSSLGSQVAVAAPGGNCVTTSTGQLCQYPIISATNAGTQGPTASTYTNAQAHNGFFDQGLGTSFSAPLVSATAALMFSVNPTLTAADVRSILTSSARAFPTTGGSVNTPVCVEPGDQDSATVQSECYCTTTTCGAGMLDTQAAVQAAAAGRAVAHLGGTPPLVTPGATVSLDGSASTGANSAAIATYLWEIVDGAALATMTSANNASSVAFATAASTTSGTFTVRLTVTDATGNSATATQRLTLGTAPTVVTATPSTVSESGGDSGGGGAFDIGWGLLMALGLAAVAHGRRRASRPA